MKYAIPLANGEVSAHFGHCDEFAFFDVDEAEKKITGRELLKPPAHEPGVLPSWLAEKGVSRIISGGMGSRAQGLFKQNNIKVITGVLENNPEKAVLKYLDGTLESGGNICDH